MTMFKRFGHFMPPNDIYKGGGSGGGGWVGCCDGVVWCETYLVEYSHRFRIL